MNKTRQPANKTRQPALVARRSLTARVMALPRLHRTLLVFAGVLTLAFALWQVLGELYPRLFISMMPLSTLTWIVAAAALSMYMAGFVYIIGMPGVTPQAGRAQSIYLLTTVILFVLSLLWLVIRTAGALA
jgi:hypothetical protein